MHPEKIADIMFYSQVRRKVNNRIFLEWFLGVLSAFGPFCDGYVYIGISSNNGILPIGAVGCAIVADNLYHRACFGAIALWNDQ